MIAALYVDPRGAYAGQAGIDLWDEARDARLYPGPHPVPDTEKRPRISKKAASATPTAFQDVLVALALLATIPGQP